VVKFTKAKQHNIIQLRIDLLCLKNVKEQVFLVPSQSRIKPSTSSTSEKHHCKHSTLVMFLESLAPMSLSLVPVSEIP